MDIHELQLITDDLDQTRHFYNKVLGLEVIYSDDVMTSFSAGHSRLSFHRSAGKNPVYHFAFNIPCNKFGEALTWMSDKSKLIETSLSDYVADFKSWNAKAFYFFDNNGNIVEMIARFDLNNSSAEPFSGASICSVSEIGMVVEEPARYAQELLTLYNLPFFLKQAPMKDFIAMGDDRGLFIIVTVNRKWYPTNVHSTQHWLKIIVSAAGRVIEITT